MTADYPPDPPWRCTGCGREQRLGLPFFMCDRAPLNEQWCPRCWPSQPCDREHEEGCATMVMTD